jgi:hypothetical protein
VRVAAHVGAAGDDDGAVRHGHLDGAVHADVVEEELKRPLGRHVLEHERDGGVPFHAGLLERLPLDVDVEARDVAEHVDGVAEGDAVELDLGDRPGEPGAGGRVHARFAAPLIARPPVAARVAIAARLSVAAALAPALAGAAGGPCCRRAHAFERLHGGPLGGLQAGLGGVLLGGVRRRDAGPGLLQTSHRVEPLLNPCEVVPERTRFRQAQRLRRVQFVAGHVDLRAQRPFVRVHRGRCDASCGERHEECQEQFQAKRRAGGHWGLHCG